MPLREHLAELRRRLFRAALAIVLGGIAGWFVYEPMLVQLQAPLIKIAHERQQLANLNFGQVAGSFNLKVKLSIYVGVVIASPVWIYQLWAFVVPGLTRREKRYSVAFVAAAVPLFLSGLAVAWLALPNAVRFLTDFGTPNSTNLIEAQDYLTFVTRLMMAFGVAFVTPLVLVALNLAGVVKAITLAKGWRVAVFLVFLFAAMASPTPDATSMLMLAFPMVGLYMGAVGIAWIIDARRARKAAADPLAGLSDDAASRLDDLTDPLDDVDHSLDEVATPVDGATPLDDLPGPHDDVT